MRSGAFKQEIILSYVCCKIMLQLHTRFSFLLRRQRPLHADASTQFVVREERHASIGHFATYTCTNTVQYGDSLLRNSTWQRHKNYLL